MRTNEEVQEYLKETRVVPNILQIFLAEFEYEDAKQYLRDEVTEKIFEEQISKNHNELKMLVDTLKNSISSLLIGIMNDVLSKNSGAMNLIDKIRFLKSFLWYNEHSSLCNDLTIEKFDTTRLVELGEKLELLDDGYNLAEFKKYMIDIDEILKRRFELIHKKDGKIMDKKVINHIPEDFERKQGKKNIYWIKKIGAKERLIIKEIKNQS